jgi:hypothetical protein
MMMDAGMLFWTFLIGLCLALSGCCVFVLLVREGQYRDPEKSKFEMYENERRDDSRLGKNVVDV